MRPYLADIASTIARDGRDLSARPHVLCQPEKHFCLNRSGWLAYAVAAGVCWGIWGVLAKGPSRELSGWMTQVLFTFALVPSAFVAARSRDLRLGTNKRWGLVWGFISGLFAGTGDLCFYLALQSGAETAIAIPLISLYPVVTLTIACLCLKEQFNRTQGAGLVLAGIAILMFSGDTRNHSSPMEALHRISLAPWTAYILIALICAGLFTVTQKLSTNYVSGEMSYLSWCSAFVVIALWVVATKPLNWRMPAPQLGAALAAGALNGFGVVAAFAAYRHGGKAAIVAPLTATLQPLVTVFLALLFLGESLDGIESGGIALAVAAVAILSHDSKDTSNGDLFAARVDHFSGPSQMNSVLSIASYPTRDNHHEQNNGKRTDIMRRDGECVGSGRDYSVDLHSSTRSDQRSRAEHGQVEAPPYVL